MEKRLDGVKGDLDAFRAGLEFRRLATDTAESLVDRDHDTPGDQFLLTAVRRRDGGNIFSVYDSVKSRDGTPLIAAF